MTFLKDLSIKTQISNLLLATILALIIVGCSVYILMFSYISKQERLDVLEKIMDNFYKEVITEQKKETLVRANTYAQLLASSKGGLENHTSVYQHLGLPSMSNQFAVIGINHEIIYSNIPHTINRTQLFENPQYINSCWIEGSIEEGIYTYALVPVLRNDDEILGFILTYGLISDQEAVNHQFEIFNVDATIFYKEIRLVTSIINNDQLAIGTKLKEDLAIKLLSEEQSFIGKTSVLSKPYLTAYKSFGNIGEKPIGIVSVGESFYNHQKIIYKMIFFVSILGLILFVSSIWFSRKWLQKNVVDPIILTSNQLAKVAEGNQDFQEHINTNSQYFEFNLLNKAIDKMVQELQDSKHQIEKIAFYDELTQLPNRFNLFNTYSNVGVLSDKMSYMIYIDLDNLKAVNNFAGQMVGDQLLKYIGQTLNKVLAKVAHEFQLYRLGGDEFIICVTKGIDKAVVEDKVINILNSFNKPFEYEDYSLDVTLSIGVAECLPTFQFLEVLLQNAEVAMYEVKRRTKASYSFYCQALGDQTRQRKELEDDLKLAIERHELFLMYQPKLDIATGKCDSFEALLRWNHPIRGLISPADFIYIAEESGLIISIGKWVLNEACAILKQIHQHYKFPFKMAVNVSTLQLNKEDFVRMVLEILVKHGLEPNHLELEITETVLIESLHTAVDKLQQLNVLGVGITIDDFGKGYSSLAYLSKLPISTLKIDKIFIDDIEDNPNALVGDIIKLSHHMNLKTVAEGVETAVQLDILKALGCDRIQGYFYSKPIKSEELYKFLSSKLGQNT